MPGEPKLSFRHRSVGNRSQVRPFLKPDDEQVMLVPFWLRTNRF